MTFAYSSALVDWLLAVLLLAVSAVAVRSWCRREDPVARFEDWLVEAPLEELESAQRLATWSTIALIVSAGVMFGPGPLLACLAVALVAVLVMVVGVAVEDRDEVER